MNGVASSTQPLWFELGAINEAQPSEDGSDRVRPLPPQGQANAKLIDDDPARGRPLLAAWEPMRQAAHDAIKTRADVKEAGVLFREVLLGTRLAAFPRSSNTYLCNNIAYTTNYLFDHPNQAAPLLRAGTLVQDRPNEVPTKVTGDFSKVAREFIHWPSELHGAHIAAAKDVMEAIIDANLVAVREGKLVRGDAVEGSAELQGGDTF
jgi:hypothetical protein